MFRQGSFALVLVTDWLTNQKPKSITLGRMCRRPGLPAVPCPVTQGSLSLHLGPFPTACLFRWHSLYQSTSTVGCSCYSNETLNPFKHSAIFLVSQLVRLWRSPSVHFSSMMESPFSQEWFGRMSFKCRCLSKGIPFPPGVFAISWLSASLHILWNEEQMCSHY